MSQNHVLKLPFCSHDHYKFVYHLMVQMWLDVHFTASGANSPRQSAEDVLDVRVVSSWFGNCDAQLSVAQGPDGSDDTCDDPDYQGHTHRAAILQHPLRTDEDTWAYNVTWWKEGEGGQVSALTGKKISSRNHVTIYNFVLAVSYYVFFFLNVIFASLVIHVWCFIVIFLLHNVCPVCVILTFFITTL